MTSRNSQEQVWQLHGLKILEMLIRTGADLPVMTWTVTPHGAVGEPYNASTDAERTAAVNAWADALGAVHWTPHTSDGMTRLTASAKNYNGSPTSIMVRTTLYGEEISTSVDQ